jgi:hypothetical protein
MEAFDQKLFRRIHALCVGHLASSLTDAEHAELESMLRESAKARRLYVEYFQETACLRWHCLEDFAGSDGAVTAVEATATDRRWIRVRPMTVILALLACLLLAVGLANWLVQPNEPNPIVQVLPPARLPENFDAPRAEAVATVTRLESANWLDAAEDGCLLARCCVGERWRLETGQAELTFDCGVMVTVFAPADFDITSATSIRCRLGRVTALVNERGKGFTVETPQGKVIDLGTQFGLDISENGETQVVVFKGRVDLAPDSGEVRRMEQGDALLIKNSGEIQRLVDLRRDDYLGRPSQDRPSLGNAGRGRRDLPLIAAVSDNIRKGQSLKSYQIVPGGLRDDALCFVDRDHEWNGLDGRGVPDFLSGADYVMPFNDDKFIGDLELSVELSRPAMLYVFIDNNMPVPDWLRDEFEDTGADIGLDGATTIWHPDDSLGKGAGQSIDFRFSVWRRAIDKPGLVKLGGVMPPKVRSLGFSMYGIAAVELQDIPNAGAR